MSGCQSCNSGCQSQNTCSKCNSCESCNVNCNGSGCNTIQTFCSSNQKVGSFSFNQPIGTDELFLKKANWNRLISHINNAYAKGNASLSNNAQSGSGVRNPGNGGNSGLPSSDENEFMTADMFNKVAAALGGLGSSGPSRRVVKDVDIVYGSYFKGRKYFVKYILYHYFL